MQKGKGDMTAQQREHPHNQNDEALIISFKLLKS
jgi:hypothetical protein